MSVVTTHFCGKDESVYYLSYFYNEGKGTLSNQHGESMLVEENDIFAALDMLFKLRGNHEPINSLSAIARK